MIEIYSDEAKKLIKKTKNTFSDFRNKYNDNIVKLINEYKEARYFFIFCFFDLI
jgi:predicted translin family RNA/ssDNA-binding protein